MTCILKHETNRDPGGRIRKDEIDYLGSVRTIVNESGDTQVFDYFPYGTLWPGGDGAIFEGNQTLFNGKEMQILAGTNLYDYGARFYNPRTGMWLTRDPLADDYKEYSPYVFCAGNPVNVVDPEGLDWYVFDENGDYIEKIEKEGRHRVVVSTIKDGVNSFDFYDFADVVNDPKDIDKGLISNLVFMSEEDIYSILDDKEVFSSSIFSLISQSHNRYDYTTSTLRKKFSSRTTQNKSGKYFESKYLFIPQGDRYAHNMMNFGNFLWGATGYTLGWKPELLLIGAHVNSLLGGENQNGYIGQFDSTDDQLSIYLGIRYAASHKYRRNRIRNLWQRIKN